MNQTVKGKIFVGMIISVIAFGFATGTGVFIGSNPLSTIGVMNLTNQGQFPVLNNTPNNLGTTNKSPQTLNTTTTQQTTQQTTQPSNSQSNTNSNTNTNSSSNNPTNGQSDGKNTTSG